MIDLREDHGYDVPTAAAATRRVPCSACGLSKRHLFDRAAIESERDSLEMLGQPLPEEEPV